MQILIFCYAFINTCISYYHFLNFLCTLKVFKKNGKEKINQVNLIGLISLKYNQFDAQYINKIGYLSHYVRNFKKKFCNNT